MNIEESLMNQKSFLKQIEFEDNAIRCKDCLKPWIKPDSIISFFTEARWYID